MCVAWVADGLPPPKAASDNESLVEVCELLHRVKACRIFPPDRPPAFPSTLSFSLSLTLTLSWDAAMSMIALHFPLF